MSKLADRRISFRIPFVAKVNCYIADLDKRYSGMLRDISITSMFVELEECPEIGYRCDIDIVFEGKFSRLVIENVTGTVIRLNEGGMAIRFDELLEWFTLIPLYFQKMRDQSLVE